MVLTLLFFSALALAAIEIRDEKIVFPGTSRYVISLANHYADQVQSVEICLYTYSDIRKKYCQGLTKDHPSFLLQPAITWSEIQRIVLRGKSISNPDEDLSCIAYQGHHADTLMSLETMRSSKIEVNYVGDNYMICSLVTDAH
jgi:hypothetical protein